MREGIEKLSKLDFAFVEHKKRMGRRLQETRNLFQEHILIGDIHSHTTYSDGMCGVEELKNYADMAGMDFLFVTDHNSLEQYSECSKFDNVWLGQEPTSVCHHIGLLSPSSLFVPAQKSFIEDWDNAENIAEFRWVPHPTGWGPDICYSEEDIKQLFNIGDNFAMEILNGVFKFDDVFDKWQADNVKLWDKLLMAGRHVTAVAGSDAHFAIGIGCVWTGVFTAECNEACVIKNLNAGRTIASEGPILSLSFGDATSPDTISVKAGEKISLKIRVSDFMGINSVKLIKNGNIIKEFRLQGKQVFKKEISEICGHGKSYYRLECVSVDYKHAFTSPVYLEAD